MNNKEKKRHIAYEVMTFLGVLALVLFITRLWPILLLVIVGIFICALRILFFSVKNIAVTPPDMPNPLPLMLPPPETEQSIVQKAFGLLQRRITENVMCAYPDARWVWEYPRPQESFAAGGSLTILLNGAGGFRKAHVIVENLQFAALNYECTGENPPAAVEAEPQTETEIEKDEQPDPDEAPTINFERIAFEWVEAHLMELSGRTNEAIAAGQKALLISSRELPHPDSWMDVCAELKHNGFEDADIAGDGIKLTLPQ